jgi:hypothetical protein
VYTVACIPIERSCDASHSAHLAVSALCSERALTLGMRRNSSSSARMRGSSRAK